MHWGCHHPLCHLIGFTLQRIVALQSPAACAGVPEARSSLHKWRSFLQPRWEPHRRTGAAGAGLVAMRESRLTCHSDSGRPSAKPKVCLPWAGNCSWFITLSASRAPWEDECSASPLVRTDLLGLEAGTSVFDGEAGVEGGCVYLGA